MKNLNTSLIGAILVIVVLFTILGSFIYLGHKEYKTNLDNFRKEYSEVKKTDNSASTYRNLRVKYNLD